MKKILHGFFHSKLLLVTSLISGTLLLAITAIHIYIVTTPKSDGYVNRQLQLARLDIRGNPTLIQANDILAVVRNSNGVSNAILNEKEHTIVYVYELGVNTSSQIQQNVSNYIKDNLNNNQISTERYTVPATNTESCPMNANQTGMFRKIGAYMHHVLD